MSSNDNKRGGANSETDTAILQSDIVIRLHDLARAYPEGTWQHLTCRTAADLICTLRGDRQEPPEAPARAEERIDTHPEGL